MIIDSLGQQVKTNIKTERAEFGVSANKAKKFLHIAVRNLYSNPVLASIVEVSQNANDEHVRKGVKKPFLVTLPTSWVPTFSVRDFGGGIPHDYMMNGYTQALESTKDSDSEMSGGWGLGRMALLSLSSTYNVVTYIDGKERNYSIFESENGIEILMTHEKNTSEPNGTLVSAPVPTNFISQFAVEAKRAFRYYEIKPTVKGDSGFKLDEPKFCLKGDGWAIEENGYTTSAVCGIYHYTLDSKNIHGLTNVQQKLLGNVGLVLFFGASDLSPMANRQGLYYNEKTVLAIKNRLNKIEEEVLSEIQKKFDACKGLYEAKMLWSKLFANNAVGPVSAILRHSSKILWNKTPIESNRIEDLDKIFGLDAAKVPFVSSTAFNVGWTRGGYCVKHENGCNMFVIAENSTVFINDLPGNRGHIRRAKSYLKEIYKKTNDGSLLGYVINFQNETAKKDFFSKTGFDEKDFKKISEVTVVPGQRNECAITRAKTKVFEWGGGSCHNRSNYGEHWAISEIDLEEEDEGVYVGIERYSPVGFNSLYEMARKVEFLKSANFIGADFKLYGFRSTSTEYDEIRKKDGWVSLDVLINQFIKTYTIPKEEHQIIADAKEADSYSYNHLFSSYLRYQTAEDMVKIANSVKNAELKAYIEKLHFLNSQKRLAQKNRFEQKHSQFLALGGIIHSETVKPTYSLDKEEKSLRDKFPILSITNVTDKNGLSILDNFLQNQK